MPYIQSIIRRSLLNTNEKLNILTWATHERVQSMMEDIPHNFYVLYSSTNKSFKTWNTQYADIPKNHILLPEFNDINEIIYKLPSWVNFDVIISHSKFGQFQAAQLLSSILHIPIINVEHTLPRPVWNKQIIKKYANMRGNINVFVSEYQKNAWLFESDVNTYIIPTGIDTQIFSPNNKVDKQPVVLSICNNWIQRDECCGFSLWCDTVGFHNIKPYFNFRVLGDTPGLSESAKSLDDLLLAYRSSSVFLNTTTISSLPTVILEAMSCGLPVVSTNTCNIDGFIIEHGKNGLIGSTPQELRQHCIELLNNKKLAEELGVAGRQTIIEKFSKERFCKDWENVLSKIY